MKQVSADCEISGSGSVIFVLLVLAAVYNMNGSNTKISYLVVYKRGFRECIVTVFVYYCFELSYYTANISQSVMQQSPYSGGQGVSSKSIGFFVVYFNLHWK